MLLLITKSLLLKFYRDILAFGWEGRGNGWLATKWLLVHPLHLAQDLALIHGQHGSILPHLLEHGTALKLVTGFLEVVPEEKKQRERSVIKNVERRCARKKTTKTELNENRQSGSRSASDTFHHVLSCFEAPTRLLPHTGSRTIPFSPNQTQTHTLREPEMDPAQNNLVIAFNAIPAHFKGRA